MALPTIITVSEDAMRNCPRAMREASLALGATHWQTIYKVVIPFSISGITSGVVLGIGRAIGETMAVLLGVVLFLITMIINFSVEYISSKTGAGFGRKS